MGGERAGAPRERAALVCAQQGKGTAALAQRLGALLAEGGEADPAVLVAGDDAPAALAETRRLSAGGARRVLVVVASTGDPATCWELLAAGAEDVVDASAVDDVAAAVAARLHRWLAVDRIVSGRLVGGNLIGSGAAWRRAVRTVVEAGRFGRAPVLVRGETGTGKELVARLVHALDPREDRGDLVVVDCTTIVPDLSGSELFGHERGAFTGAAAARDGAFALAHRGTLFLDEIGDLPLGLQAELLRAIQEGTYKRVGSNRWQRTDFRLVCATHRDLVAEAEAGRFRTDLLWRLAGTCVVLPPLRERREDVLDLARHFLAEAAGGPVDLDPAIEHWLVARAWPGNVRELRQVCLRLAQRHVGPGPVTVGAVPPEDRPPAPVAPGCGPWHEDLRHAIDRALAAGAGLKDLVDAARDTAVAVALRDADGRTSEAASRLGITDRAVQLRRAALSGTDLAGRPDVSDTNGDRP